MLLKLLVVNIVLKGEYVRLAYRTYTPRPLRCFQKFLLDSTTEQSIQYDIKTNKNLFREVAGDVVLVTGAGHGMGRSLKKCKFWYMLVLNMVTEKLQILVPDCFEHGDHKDNTRQLALRLASLGCLVVCIDRDGDTNQTTVDDIQVKPISEFQKTFFKT